MYLPDNEESYRFFVDTLSDLASEARPMMVTLGTRDQKGELAFISLADKPHVTEWTFDVVAPFRLFLERLRPTNVCFIHEPPAGPEGDALIVGLFAPDGVTGVYRAQLRTRSGAREIVGIQKVSDDSLPEHLKVWFQPLDAASVPEAKLAAFREIAERHWQQFGPSGEWAPIAKDAERALEESSESNPGGRRH